MTARHFKFSRLFCSFLLVFLSPSEAVDYCTDVRKDCGGGFTNLVCRRENKCDATGNCKEVAIHKDVKDFLLDRINEIRNKAAMGQGRIQGKKAADMRAMSWDDELAFIAQCAVNLCETRLKNACPVASKFPNPHIIYANRLDVLFDDDFNYFNETIKGWEAYGSGMSGLTDFAGPRYDYAALIIGKSSAVGCGWSRVLTPIFYHNYNGHYFFAACVFAEMPMKDVFVEGEPCTKCPAGTSCNSRFKALCGEIRYADRSAKEPDYYDYHEEERGCGTAPSLRVLVLTAVALNGLVTLLGLV